MRLHVCANPVWGTNYTCDTSQTRNKLLAQWVHLTTHTAGHSRPGTTHQTAKSDLSWTAIQNDAVNRDGVTDTRITILRPHTSNVGASRWGCQRISVLWHTIAPRALPLPLFTRRRACAVRRVVLYATTESTLHALVC